MCGAECYVLQLTDDRLQALEDNGKSRPQFL